MCLPTKMTLPLKLIGPGLKLITTRLGTTNKTGEMKVVKKHVKTMSGRVIPALCRSKLREATSKRQQIARDWCSGPATTWVYQVVSLHQQAP